MSELAEMIRADGSSVCYTDTGKGTPLLFIHGWLMSHRAWFLQAPLSAGFRVITLDLRGHGSDAGAGFSYHDCCDDIALLCDRLQLDRFFVVGWSMGAQITIKVYHTLKVRISGLVLVGGTPHFCSSHDFAYGIAPAEARSMGIRVKKDFNRTAAEFFRSMISPEESAGVDMRLLAESVVHRLPARDVALSALKELIDTDLRAGLAFISTPVMLIHGLDDTICLPGASQFMAEKIPSATLTLIPGAGHAPFLVNPAAFNNMLSGFVQAVHG